MHCIYCGEALFAQEKFCTACGKAQPDDPGDTSSAKSNLMGFSPKINDPAFARYKKNSARWPILFSIIIAAAAVIGFYIYGETSYEMDNPQALFIGLGIGGMFIAIAIIQVIGRKKSSTTWDGTVVDKKIEHKRKKQGTEDNWYWQKYTLYTVVVRSEGGKTHELSAEDDDTLYNYWKVGDKLRHHAGLSYEKYDKSEDDIIFCTACASLNDIKDDYCFRCKCPLLK